jgi:hypothetical protein
MRLQPVAGTTIVLDINHGYRHPTRPVDERRNTPHRFVERPVDFHRASTVLESQNSLLNIDHEECSSGSAHNQV